MCCVVRGYSIGKFAHEQLPSYTCNLNSNTVGLHNSVFMCIDSLVPRLSANTQFDELCVCGKPGYEASTLILLPNNHGHSGLSNGVLVQLTASSAAHVPVSVTPIKK